MEPQRRDVLAAGAGVTSGYGYRRRMLISEEFLLLVTSPEGKWLAASGAVPLALAGGLLAELALQGKVTVDHRERIVVVDRSSPRAIPRSLTGAGQLR
jgi:Golgi phosphoprotein 3 (GPP34)